MNEKPKPESKSDEDPQEEIETPETEERKRAMDSQKKELLCFPNHMILNQMIEKPCYETPEYFRLKSANVARDVGKCDRFPPSYQP